ncbi:MAG: phosphotransferase, partial [Terracoccus sp.]
MVSGAYVEKIREVYPGLALDHLQLISDGMVNDVVVVNRELVCRFVRDAGDAETLAREAAVLSVIHDRVELSTPRLERLEAGFASYRYIPGEPLSRNALARLSAPGRSRI